MLKKIIIALLLIILTSGLFYLGYYLYITYFQSSSQTVTQPTTTEKPKTEEGVLYQSDFSKSSALSDWQIIDEPYAVEGPSNWKIENNNLVQTSNIWGGTFGEPVISKSYLGTLAYLKQGLAWQNYEVDLKFNPTDNDGVGFIVRYQDQNNYYKVMIVLDSEKDNGGPFIKIDKNLNGTFITLFQKPLTYKLGQENTIKIVVNGALIEVYLNSDTKTIWATDPDASFKTGSFGLSCFAEEGVSFWNIVIKSI